MTNVPATASSAGPVAGHYQDCFAQRWAHLHHPHVRALAWLLESPDLLAPEAACWSGRVATLGPLSAHIADWLASLERDPSALLAALASRHYSRLGLYAEKLMAFYFAEHGQLLAHGLQVRANRNDTVGEFDFLLRDGAALLHLEFATKFYLLDADTHTNAGVNALIGPNLADTLGAKMRKIFDKQLTLGAHPAAQALLPQPVARAQALVKGWLFYPAQTPVPAIPGIAPAHCHGNWMTLSAAQALAGDCYAIVPRLHWLAPLKLALDSVALRREELLVALDQHMAQVAAPLMVVHLRQDGPWLLEQQRSFIVPDDWRAQAAQRRLDGTLPT